MTAGENVADRRRVANGSRRANLDVLLLTLLCWPALRPLFGPNFLATDDGLFHLFRLVELDRLVKVGEIYPRLAPDLAIGYDYPVFNYYAPLGLYISEFFRLLGFSATDATKAVFALSILGAAWTMRLLLDPLLDRTGAFLGALAFAYVPYLLVDVYHRGALAESLAMALLPLVLWASGRLAREPGMGTAVLAAVSIASLVLAHNITALFALPVVGAYWLFSMVAERSVASWRRAIPYAGLGLTLGLALSAFYWAPALGEIGDATTGRATIAFFDFHQHLQVLSRLFTSALIYNYQTDFSLLFRIGPLQIGPAGLGLLVAITRRGAARRQGIFWAGVLVAMAFLMWTHSAFVWEHVPLLAYAQFPWRLLTIVGVASSVLIGYLGSGLGAAIGWASRALVHNERSRTLARTGLTLLGEGIVSAALIGSAIGGLQPQPLELRPIEARPWTAQQAEHAFNAIAYSIGEYLPPWASTVTRPVSPDQATPGTTLFTVRSAGPFAFDLTATADQAMPVTFDRFYFPGWQAQIDGQPAATRASGPQGLLTLDVPAGTHHLEIWFGPTAIRAATAVVSGLSLLTLVGVGIFRLRRRRNRRSPNPAHVFDRKLPVASGRPTVPRVLIVVPAVAVAATLAVVAIGTIGTTIQAPTAKPTLLAPGDFGGEMRLAGATESSVDGDRLDLTLYWQALKPINRDYAVDVRLVDSSGRTVGQRTKAPNFGLRPTNTWQPGELVRDNEEISLVPGTSAGPFGLSVGVVDPATGAAVPLDGSTSEARVLSATDLRLPGRPVPSEPNLVHTASGSFGGQVAIDRYEIHAIGTDGAELATVSAGSSYVEVRPGERLRIDVAWRVLRDLADNYTVFVHLTDHGGQLVSQHDDWPRQRFYPTLLWLPGEVIPDEYDFTVPDNAATGLDELSIGLYRQPDLRRLPLQGGPAGADQLSLGPIKVVPLVTPTATSLALPRRDDASFGGEINLLGHGVQVGSTPLGSTSPVSAQPGSQLTITLYWQAARRPTRDYTTFIHVVDATGQIVAQTDGQPLNGAYPTSAWDPGEIVTDPHQVELPKNLPSGTYHVIVGLYQVTSGVRLQLPSRQDQVILDELDVR